MKLNQIKIGSVLSYAQIALSIIIGFIYTPVMIRLLGQNEYGLYNTVSSTISMLSLLSLGFNSGYVRYYSKYKKNNDINSIEKLNGLFLIIFIIIGIVALICGLFLTFNLNIVFNKGLTIDEYKTARILMLLLVIRLTLSFPMSVFASIITVHERFIYLKVLGLINTVFSPLITLPLLLMGFKSIAMVSVSVLLSIFVDSAYLYYVVFKLKQKFIFKGFEKGLFKSLVLYTSFIALNMIIDQINWNVDKMILGRFKGTATVAIYSIGYNLYHYYGMFSTSISGVFTPRIHKIVNETNANLKKQKIQLTEIFTKVGRLQFLVMGMVASGFLFFGYDFISLWVGKQYKESYYVALLLILPASIALIQNLGLEIQRAENKHQFRSITYAIMALINLILSIYLCQIYGAVGSAIGTAISLVVANGIIMNVFYHIKCNIDIIYFWRQILSLAKGMLIPVVFAAICTVFIKERPLITFCLLITAYVIVYSLSMWKYGMNNYEKNLISSAIKKIIRKK